MNNQQHFLWVALLSTVVWGGVMFWEVSVFKTDCASRYGFKTILVDGACSMASRLAELELARDASRFENIILQGLAPGSENGSYERWNIEVIRAVITAISIAAVFDVLENIRLFQSFHALRFALTSTNLPAGVSAVKWAFSVLR